MPLRRALPWLLAAALLAAQLLGLVHRVVHAPVGTGLGPVAHLVPAAAAAPHAQDGLAALLPAHDDSSCRLYDALGLDAAPVFLLALGLTLPVFVRLHFLLGEFLARRAALFEARGPPAAVS